MHLSPSYMGCISFDSYIKPQLFVTLHSFWSVVYLLIPTSNHNVPGSWVMVRGVVYLLIPTSNHNVNQKAIGCKLLYIFWFLHQTTTARGFRHLLLSCISFDSYIKPQPLFHRAPCAFSCISFDSYIKPQLLPESFRVRYVVYLLIPTSNHNCCLNTIAKVSLYIFWFLHQTTTCCMMVEFVCKLYIFWFLHQTTTTLDST